MHLCVSARRKSERRNEIAGECEGCLFFEYVENSLLYDMFSEVMARASGCDAGLLHCATVIAKTCRWIAGCTYYYRPLYHYWFQTLSFQILRDNRFYKVRCLRIRNRWVITRLIGCLNTADTHLRVSADTSRTAWKKKPMRCSFS